MRRIERLVNLIAAFLETLRPLTAEDIRHQVAGYGGTSLEAFRRSFERDKETLRDMGVPLEIVPTDAFSEQADGYIIPKDRYYLPELDLEPEELAALKLASEAMLGRGEKDAEAGMLKLSLAEEPGGWAGPRVTMGAELSVEEPSLGDIYTALVERKPITFSYEVPASFDADDVPAESWEFGPDAVDAVTVRFAPEVKWWAEQNLTHLDPRPGPGDAVEVDVPTGNVAALLGWVVGWHGTVTIVS